MSEASINMSCGQTNGFFILPAELRDAVYDNLMAHDQIHITAKDDPENEFKGQFESILALAHTAREVRHEILSYMRRQKEWVFWGRDAVDSCKELPKDIASHIGSAAFWALTLWIQEDGLHAHECQVQGLCTLLETCTQLRRIDIEIAHHCHGFDQGQAVKRVFEVASMSASSVALMFSWYDKRDVDEEAEGVRFLGCTDDVHREAVMDKLRTMAIVYNVHTH